MRSRNPLVSIVIPVYNAKDFIVPALKSILKTDYSNFEVVIIDDLSTDGSFELIKKDFGKNTKIHIYRNKTKQLAAGSRNAGVEHARGDFIALLDHDIEVDKDWIKELLKVMQKHPKCGIVQSRVMDIKDRHIIQHAGVKINAYLGWVIPVGFGMDGRKNFTKEQLAFANATGLLFKKEVWEKLGGFDEMLAINTDDWDFNWRSYLYGYKHYLAPKALTYHWSKKQQTRDAWINRITWEFHFAKVPWIFIKNYELKNIFRYLPVYLFVNFARGVFNLCVRFNPAPLIAFFKSVQWIIANFSILLKQRRKVQSNRQVLDQYLLKNLFDTTSIWGYFSKYWLHAFKVGKSLSTENPY